MGKIHKLIAQHCPSGVECMELQEIFELRRVSSHSKPAARPFDDLTVHWFSLEDICKSGLILSDSIEKVSKESIGKQPLFPANSIIISTTGSTIRFALITVPHMADEMFTCLTLKPEFSKKLDMLFINHYCFVLENWCYEHPAANFEVSVDMKGFKRFKIAIPPLPVQQEIVHILDSFAKLEEDLESELELRRKQHAYYRHALFSFNEIDKSAFVADCDLHHGGLQAPNKL